MIGRHCFRTGQLIHSLAVLALFGTLSAAEPVVYPDHTRLLIYLDDDGKEQPVKSSADWSRRREHVLKNMQSVMGELPGNSRKVPLDVRMTDETKLDGYVLRKLTFAVEKDDRVPAYLLVPSQRQGKLPAVLCLHQTNGKLGKKEPAGLGGSESLHYAADLARMGYVTLAPDYPSFGEYAYEFGKDGWPSGSSKAVWNNLRAVDLLQSLAEVDGERIGCIGHSLGGHNAMFTAVFDTRIKAIVSNCGFTSFPKYYGGKLHGWASARYMPRIATLYEDKPEKVPFDFTEVAAALAPRAFLASSPSHDDNFDISGVKDVMSAARPVYELLGAGDKLSANHPDCKHDFPPDARKVAYDWLDRWLK
jgi:dienelactone hydrolase